MGRNAERSTVKVAKAVITAAGRSQRALPLQTLVDSDGVPKSVLGIIVEEALRAGVEDICVVVSPGDEAAFRDAAGEHAGNLKFVPQSEPRGYGHAVYSARDFVGDAPFLHMVGDHVYISSGEQCCAQQLIATAEAQSCAISGVQPTRENLLPYFGAVGGKRLAGSHHLYDIDRVIEKPTPTEAEQTLLVPGLRAGHYLCFFGMHVLTPTLMEILHSQAQDHSGSIGLSPALAELARRERYLALEAQGRRYALDGKYGLLTAQLAIALSGQDREEVLAGMLELLAQRELTHTG